MSTRVRNIQESVHECLRPYASVRKQSGSAAAQAPQCPYPSAKAARLVERLGHQDLPERHLAMQELLRLDEDCAPLLHAMLDEKDWDRRHLEAIEVLKRLGRESSKPVLKRALGRRADAERLAALRGLRWLQCQPDDFLDSLEDPSWEVRREAVFALVELRQPQLRFVLAGMARDPHPLVRGAAVNALGMLGILGDPELKAEVCRALSDRSEWVRSMAAWAAGHLRLTDCRAELARAFIRGGDAVHARAARSAARLGARAVAEELLRHLPSASMAEQARIIQALGSLGHPAAMPALAEIAAAPDPALSRLAARALQHISGE